MFESETERPNATMFGANVSRHRCISFLDINTKVLL